MLREEERKKHRVRTRSEIEVENMLLRRELEELRECQKKFRASPAPAHIHLPLYEMISCRSSQRSNQSRSSSKKTRNPDVNGNQTSTAVSPQPFHFLERERRKREAKIVEELGNFGQKMERQTFKARPLPVSIYGTRHREDPMTTSCSHESQTFYTLEGGSDGQSDQSSDLELEMHQSDSSLSSRMSQRSPSSKPVKKQIELSIEMVAERERPSTEPRSWAAQSFCWATKVIKSVCENVTVKRENSSSYMYTAFMLVLQSEQVAMVSDRSLANSKTQLTQCMVKIFPVKACIIFIVHLVNSCWSFFVTNNTFTVLP